MGIFSKNPQISYHINMSRKVDNIFIGALKYHVGINHYYYYYGMLTVSHAQILYHTLDIHLKSTAEDWNLLIGLEPTPINFVITPIEKLLDDGFADMVFPFPVLLLLYVTFIEPKLIIG